MTGERRFKQHLVRRARFEAGDRVLDIGCGTGTLLTAADEQAPDLRLHGVDRDPAMLSRAAARGMGHGGFGLYLGDGRELPVATGSVDAVVSSLFFHHLHDHDKAPALAEVARVLRPGGRLVIADWGAPRSPTTRLAASVTRAFDRSKHTHTIFADDLPGRVADAGFDSVRTVERLGVPLGMIDIIVATAPGTHAS